MDREFLETFNEELTLLYERAGHFAEDFPGVADRLGGLARDRMDPGIQGVLEGSAFLAARVQLKLKSEFRQFTDALLEQVLPNYLAPIPSAAIVRIRSQKDDPEIAQGRLFKAGSTIDAVYVERDGRTSCRYRTTEDVCVRPIEVVEAIYLPSSAGLATLGLETTSETAAGLRLAFELKLPVGDIGFGTCGLDELPIHLAGAPTEAISLYEQIFASCARVSLRWTDAFDRPTIVPLRDGALHQIGFDAPGALFGSDDRVFPGFELLRDFFAFPQRYVGFRICGLAEAMRGFVGRRMEILFEFTRSVPRLVPAVRPAAFVLNAVPVVNLFEMSCSRTVVRPNEHEHMVVPDRSRPLDFEAHRVLEVHAHYSGLKEKVRIHPLYSMPDVPGDPADFVFYDMRRRPRSKTAEERRLGTAPNYMGNEIFLTLAEPAGVDDEDRIAELSVRVLASNRHLAARLPVGSASADFFFTDNTSVVVECVGTPTLPRDPVVESGRGEGGSAGRTQWLLVGLLSLNHLALVDADGARRLRDVLGLFAEMSDISAERRIRGVVSVTSGPVVRRIRQSNGFNAARGIEIVVVLDETAFEGTGAFLLGAVLDRFFAEYASINTFTQTVVRSVQRGVIVKWPPRTGRGKLL